MNVFKTSIIHSLFMVCSVEWIHTSSPSSTTREYTHYKRVAATRRQAQHNDNGKNRNPLKRPSSHFKRVTKTDLCLFIEWKHCSVNRQTSGLYLRGGHTESRHRGGYHHHNGNLSMPARPKSIHLKTQLTVFLLRLSNFVAVNMDSHQTVTEKHKLNVPETMTEVLDVSDEEGESI